MHPASLPSTASGGENAEEASWSFVADDDRLFSAAGSAAGSAAAQGLDDQPFARQAAIREIDAPGPAELGLAVADQMPPSDQATRSRAP